MIPRQLFVRQLVHRKQRPQSRILRLFNLFQAVFYQNAVFVGKLHHIPHRGKPCKGQKLLHKRPFCLFRHRACPAHPVKIKRHHLIGYHRAADPFVWVRTVLLIRIHHRIRRRKGLYPAAVLPRLIRHLVMIRHNHRHAKRLRRRYLRRRRNAVVTGQKRVNAVPGGLLNQPPVKSVTVRNTIGNHHIRQPAADFQTYLQYVSRADAVNVIVPDHAYPFLFFRLPNKNLRRLFGVFQKRRIVQVLCGCVKEFLNLFLPHHIPVPYDPGDHGINVKPLCYLVKIRLLGGNHPFTHKKSLRKATYIVTFSEGNLQYFVSQSRLSSD